jgi:hypothetical protein
MLTPKIWASANMIKLSDEWSYLFYVLWFEDERHKGLPIEHHIVFKNFHYIHNSEETYQSVFEEIAFHVNRMQIKLEDYFKNLGDVIT